MAYLDIREPLLAAPLAPIHDPIPARPIAGDEAHAAVPAAPVHVAIEAGFDRNEWQVIVLARHDGLASLREPSWLARQIARLFGAPVNRRLANPRLEALRRFAVVAWQYGYMLPVSAIKAFKEAGFSLDQTELLLASVAFDRTRQGRHA